jgi:hypothetical protein
MAKKQKRSVSSVRTAPISTVVPNGDRPAYNASAARTSYTPEFNPDYSVVISDLKRIGMMAGSFIVILVVLSFFLR